MSFQKFKSDSYCFGGRHKSGTRNIVGEITYIKKSGEEIKLLVGKCVICDKRKSTTVSDNVIQAEGLGDFFKNLGNVSSKAAKKLARNALKNSNRLPEIGANVATAAATKNPKAALSPLPEVINFYHTSKGLYLGKFFQFLPYKWKRKQIDYTLQHH